MPKTQTTTNDLDIPAALRRSTNSKGVTLSAGVEPAKPAVASGAKKSEPKAERVAGSKPRTRKADKAAAPVAVVAPAAPVTPAPVVDEEGNPLPIRRSIVPGRFKAKYKAHGGTCGDDMALELKAATTVLNADKRPSLDWEALKVIGEANGINCRVYDGLNNGQKRMNVGNKLRGRLAEGHDVTIGTRVFKAEDWTPRTPAKSAAQATA